MKFHTICQRTTNLIAMKKYYFLQSFWIVLLSICFNLLVAQDWIHYYPGLMKSNAFDMVLTPDGGFLMAGEYYPSGEDVGIIVRADPEGEQLWVVEQEPNVYLRSVYAHDDGTYLAAGIKATSGGYVQLTDTVGNPQWAFTDTLKATDFLDVIRTSDGGVLACGVESYYESPECASCKTAVIAKLDSLGNPLWTTHWYSTGLSFSYARGVYENADGEYIIIGDCRTDVNGDSQQNAFWARLDTAGNILQSEIYAFPEDTDEITSFDVDNQGNLWLTGQSNSLINNGWAPSVYKIDSNGQLLFRETITNYPYWRGEGIVATPDSGAIVTGRLMVLGNVTWVNFKLNQNQVLEWMDPLYWLGAGTSGGVSIELLPDDHYAIFGSSEEFPSFFSMTLLKTDSFGNVYS